LLGAPDWEADLPCHEPSRSAFADDDSLLPPGHAMPPADTPTSVPFPEGPFHPRPSPAAARAIPAHPAISPGSKTQKCRTAAEITKTPAAAKYAETQQYRSNPDH